MRIYSGAIYVSCSIIKNLSTVRIVCTYFNCVNIFQPDLPSADEQFDFFVRQWESEEEDDKLVEDKTKTEVKKEGDEPADSAELKVCLWWNQE